MQEKELINLGLNESEAKVYLKLLEIGSCKAGRLAKELKYNRTTIYKALDNLTEKGLVSFVIKENRKYFEAADPENLKENIKTEEEKLKEKKETVEKILPDLKQLFKTSKPEQEANIYKGIKGLKTVFNDILQTLKEGEEYLAFGVPEHAQIFWGYFEEFNNVLQKNKVKCKIIFDESAEKNIESCKKYGYGVKTLPKEYMTPAEVNIFKNKTAIVLWGKNPIAFLIKSSDVANSFKSYFNLLWKIAKE